WTVLRTAAIVAEWLSSASGLARHRVDWNVLRKQRVPLLPFPKQRKIGNLLRNALKYESHIQDCRKKALQAISGLDLEGDEALDRLARAKPPQ
ncbi:MAG: hypothetical protein QOF93_284, partial [Verrucomicrobiota bacterium]